MPIVARGFHGIHILPIIVTAGPVGVASIEATDRGVALFSGFTNSARTMPFIRVDDAGRTTRQSSALRCAVR
jgi:hypothetical protein